MVSWGRATTRRRQNDSFVFTLNFLFSTGNISVKKARRAIRSLDLTIDKQVIQSHATNDAMDYSTFYHLTGPKLVQRAKALRAFHLFDKDGKGVVCLEDLQRVAIELEEEMTERELIEMLDDADKEGQGFLSEEDFLSVAESLNL